MKKELPTIEQTINFAMAAHGTQTYGTMPYIVHLMMVAHHFDDRFRQTVAILHDIIEDTLITLGDIEHAYGSEVANVVNALTRKDGENYMSEYIYRLSNNKVAIEIKIADLEENLWSLHNWYPEYASLEAKYITALAYLTSL